VRFTPTFPCPLCEKEIRVSDIYQRTMRVASWSVGLVIPYIFGGRLWFLLLYWIPCSMAVLFLWAYAGKYLLPPKLLRCVAEYPSILGLGPGPH